MWARKKKKIDAWHVSCNFGDKQETFCAIALTKALISIFMGNIVVASKARRERHTLGFYDVMFVDWERQRRYFGNFLPFYRLVAKSVKRSEWFLYFFPRRKHRRDYGKCFPKAAMVDKEIFQLFISVRKKKEGICTEKRRKFLKFCHPRQRLSSILLKLYFIHKPVIIVITLRHKLLTKPCQCKEGRHFEERRKKRKINVWENSSHLNFPFVAFLRHVFVVAAP